MSDLGALLILKNPWSLETQPIRKRSLTNEAIFFTIFPFKLTNHRKTSYNITAWA